MKTKLRKTTTFVLLVLTICLLASCQKETDSPQETTNAETEKKSFFKNVPDEVFFEDYEFNVLTYDNQSWNSYIEIESYTGDVLSNAAYTRNIEILDKLGVTIKTIKIKDSSIFPRVRQDNLAGDNEYDLISFWSTGNQFASLITSDELYNWKDLPYVTLTEEWYNQSANDVFDIKNKQFYAVSDITKTIQQHFRFLCNLDLLDAFGLESPYPLVFDGKWTYDKLLQYISSTYLDLNNNGVSDAEDRYGLVTNSQQIVRFVSNWGEDPLRVKEDGFELNLFSDRLVSIMEKMVGLATNPNVYGGATTDSTGVSVEFFNSGNILFQTYASDPVKLNDIEFDFAYLPYPKYDETQENYIVAAHGGILGIPISVKNVEVVGAVIEAMSESSNKYLFPAFVESYIEGRVLRDEESVEIYRMMHKAMTYDPARILDPSGTLSGLSYFRDLIVQKSTNLSSRYASLSPAIIRSYNELYDAILGD